MVWILVLVSWVAASVVTAVLFAAVGRAALREDRDLGYLEPEAGVVPVGSPEPEGPAWPAEPIRQEVVRSSASR
jgi:hypothetical protein